MKTCVLILDNLRSVENTGSIFRTSEAFGVKKIYLLGTTPTPLDRFGRKRADFAKVALGAEGMLDWEYTKDIRDVVGGLKGQGFQVMSLEQDPRAKKLATQRVNKLCLIIGNETEGVSEEALVLSDRILEIPMTGQKESLNVSVSVGIALYELLK